MPWQKDALIRKAKEYILAHELILPGQNVVAAVSGGADSMALITVLAALRQELDFSLSAAYFDHQLREESAAEGELAEEWVNGLNIPFYRGAAPVRELAQGKNLENTARKLRHGFLKEVARMTKAQRIATGHHKEDQGETLLLHLLRGSGSEGLAAMAPKEGRLIRPFLAVSKEEILAFCQAHQLPYATDASNFSPEYTRNRLRLEIIPLLEDFNPQLMTGLSVTADILREENQLLQAAAVGALEEVRLPSEGLRGGVLAALPLALQRRVLRLAYEEYALPRGAFSGSLGFEHTQRVLALKEGAMLPLPKGLWAYRQGGDILFSKTKPLLEKFTEVLTLKCGSWQPLADWGWAYRCEIIPYTEAENLLQGEHLPADTLLLPAEVLPGLAFRTRREGDFIRLPNMIGRKKLKELFIDCKVPAAQRPGWPVLLLDDAPIWLPDLRRGQLPELKGPALRIICRPCP